MVVITRKFQVTLPKSVRKDLEVDIGDRVVFLKDESGSYRLVKDSDFTRQFCEDSHDISKTIEEVRRGLGKGVERDRN